MDQSSGSNLHFRGHVPALDGLRGLAILMVLFSHFLLREWWPEERLYYLVQSGWIGVDLFFVLSGFLITGILIDSKHRADYWSRFYQHRLLRIFPLYYTVVLITWATVLLVEQAPERLQGYDGMGWFMYFSPNIAMALKNNWLYHSHIFNLNHLWSLAVEEQFYILWPMIVYFTPLRRLPALCALLVLASYLIRIEIAKHLGENSVAAYVLPFTRMDGLAAGAFLAAVYRLDVLRRIPLHFWLAGVLLLLSGYELVQIFLTGYRLELYTVSALFFAFLLHLSFRSGPWALLRRVGELAFLRHLGKYSYGLYVFHHMFEYAWLNGFGYRLMHSGWPAWPAQTLYILFAFAGSYLLARLSWGFIEQPFLKLKKR